jgi:hypothetical protein
MAGSSSHDAIFTRSEIDRESTIDDQPNAPRFTGTQQGLRFSWLIATEPESGLFSGNSKFTDGFGLAAGKWT